MSIGGRIAAYEVAAVPVLSTAFGVSLRLSNQALFIKAKWLRKLRNKIAHEGEAVDRDECNQLVLAATQLFDWLDAIQPTP
ncbi:hypothetical protein [Micromonospora sp. NPDC126480]|uniref:hypothetical protein n=1 Tax=Micromonospora sp. NPDC126480 TaxID=3155312 RepID=UPI00332558AD